METDWSSAIVTALLLAPPSILGLRAIFRGPTRFADKAVPEPMDRVAAAIWLAALPLSIVIVFTRLHYFPPRSMDDANRLANEWAPMVVRVTSVLCLIAGGAIALLTAIPVVKPKRKEKSRNKSQKRRR